MQFKAPDFKMSSHLGIVACSQDVEKRVTREDLKPKPKSCHEISPYKNVKS
jgi:hypothetical protein